ncbi:hypothetical protein J4N45_06550 [Vibrio sp. SCSIO 43140]|uniref:hypothetical protein n=1 Tax=Vibrio sp. SCSIO 43140 TaxID=2819100 RepID=UPI0020764E1B|nr:hypothetical protein [Vibrio sp. SCSIO 43140]USD61614.1 hypothetical protein J4N45_06550 [Vibrio sp. SCSIO 43140]
MDSEGQDAALLIRLPNGALLFNREFLKSQLSEPNALSPEQVLCENPEGIFKDFGNGFYAFISTPASSYKLILTCTLGDMSFKTCCNLDVTKALELPKELAIGVRPPEVLGYSILSDGTVMIPVTIAKKHASDSYANVGLSELVSATVSENGYVCERTSRYLVVYPRTSHEHRKNSTACHLKLKYSKVGQESEHHSSMCVEPGIFDSIFTDRSSLNSKVACFHQSELKAMIPDVASPIAFVDRVYSLKDEQFLEPRGDGSFVDLNRQCSRELDAYAYLVSDGVEHVALCVAINARVNPEAAMSGRGGAYNDSIH